MVNVFSNSTANVLVVRPRVDVLRDLPGHAYLDDVAVAALDQLPHRLVALQRAEVVEHGAAERERVAAAVLVARHRDRRLAVPREQRAHGSWPDPGLVAEHEHEHVAARVEGGQRGGDRGRATLTV